MSGLSEAILIKIRESERDGLEKHRKIAEYEKIIKELQFLDNCEKEKITSLESKIDQAEGDFLARKVELSKLDIRIKAVEEVIEQKRDEAVSSQQARLQKLREMTEMMDAVAENTRSYVSKYSIIADPEEVEARRKARQEEREQERQEMEVLKEELSEYEAAIARRSSLETRIDQAKEKLAENTELRDQLEAEASSLMQELTRVQMQRNTESDLAKEVKLLKQKVCVLIQEGRISRAALAGMEDTFDFSLREINHNQQSDQRYHLPQSHRQSDLRYQPPQSPRQPRNSHDLVRNINAAAVNNPSTIQKHLSRFKFRKT